MLPLMELQRQVQKVRRRKEAYQSIDIDDSSSDNWENSDVDPDYDPSVDDVNWTSPKHSPRKRQRIESDPQENTPLKYMQVSVDAMRVITQDPEQLECAHQEPFISACSDMERDNSEIPTSTVSTNTQVSVLECSAAPTPDTPLNLCQRSVEGKGEGMSVHGKMFREKHL
ncbi:hypothetical protein ElyMa_002830100 [Elysia marginata]|uniref:Uncharacterized protein n=1 Tax=Elysia marginata TaxID=1093978 RepID=A0AAV4HSB4_9GAST|nr:hypothetical protein ElyMa_002830100 [Elysia marginata]